jgi:hypothetical protein
VNSHDEYRHPLFHRQPVECSVRRWTVLQCEDVVRLQFGERTIKIHGHVLLLNRVMPLHQIPNCCYKRIDVFKGVVERERCADRALQSKAAENGLRAVMPERTASA